MAGFLLACLPVAAQTQQPIGVNCGGANYTDSNGQVWQADTGFNTGTASPNAAVTAGSSDFQHKPNSRSQFQLHGPKIDPHPSRLTVHVHARSFVLLFG